MEIAALGTVRSRKATQERLDLFHVNEAAHLSWQGPPKDRMTQEFGRVFSVRSADHKFLAASVSLPESDSNKRREAIAALIPNANP